MSVQTVTNYLRNGKQNGVGQAGRTHSLKFWQKVQINEWTFSLFLFVISLAIVTGKVLINYGHDTKWPANVCYNAPSLPAFSHMYDVFAVPNFQQLSGFNKERLKVASEKIMNVSCEYGDAMAGVVTGISHRFGWLFRAAFCGLAMMSFTWFIIYKDSSIPGVNPPSPFSPSKRQYPEKSRLQINYLVGVLNGILIFIYMCL